jgi:hypothetical protein
MRAVLSGQKTILINQSGLNIQRLSDLVDVDTTGVQDGYMIVYDQASRTYVVTSTLDKQRIDCGVF